MHLHFHHAHDIAGCVDNHDWPDWAEALIATLDRRDLQLMAAVQDSINAAAVLIPQLAGEVRDLKAKVADLESAVTQAAPAADVSQLDAAMAAAADVVPAAPADSPAPAEPAPSDAPAQPAEVPVPTTDGTVPVQSVPSVPLA